MDIGLFFWGSCFIDDAGAAGPDPYDRHHTPQDFAEAYFALHDWAKLAERHGYHSFWLTEHHFQREGYEIIPNGLMLGAIIAQHTQKLKFGSFFHQVPTWHPLRMAEDFATADIMTGGRMLFGAGRGSVQREMPIFGTTFGRTGDAEDQRNSDLFEEQMEIMKLAWSQKSFSYQGSHYTLPAPGYLNTGHPATGRPFDEITLVPAPVHPVQIYQALGSEPTFHYAAKHSHTGVMPLFNHSVTLPKWKRFGELLAQYQERPIRPGEGRMLVTRTHIADTREEAIRRIRAGHDERYRFLAQQRPIGGYLTETGEPFPFGRVPTLEESMAQGSWLVGTADDVREGMLALKEQFGLEAMAVEMGYSGMSKSEVSEQIARFATEIMPALKADSIQTATTPEPVTAG